MVKPICIAAKGEKGGVCNRKACNENGAFWFNKSTIQYYCKNCAFEIMSYPENKGLCINEKDYSHPYAVEYTDAEGVQSKNFATAAEALVFSVGKPNSKAIVRKAPVKEVYDQETAKTVAVLPKGDAKRVG